MKKTLVIGVLGMAMSLALCGSAFAEEVSYEADVNGDGKVVVGYISKNFTDPFHAPINARAEEYFDQAVADGVIDEWTGLLDGETDPNKQLTIRDEIMAKGIPGDPVLHVKWAQKFD